MHHIIPLIVLCWALPLGGLAQAPTDSLSVYLDSLKTVETGGQALFERARQLAIDYQNGPALRQAYSRYADVLAKVQPYSIVAEHLAEGVHQLHALGQTAEAEALQDDQAKVYLRAAAFPEAQALLLDNLARREARKDTVERFRSYNYLGQLHGLQHNDSLAASYFKQALEVAKLIPKASYQISALGNLGISYMNMEQWDSATEYLRTGLQMKQQQGSSPYSLAYSLHNLGLAFERQGRLDSALHYYQATVEIRDSLGDHTNLASTYNNLGWVYYQQAKYPQALRYYQDAEALALETGETNLLRNIWSNFSEIYRDQGRYQRAYRYLYQFDTLNRRLFDETKALQLAELETKYQTEKQEKELAQLAVTNARQREEVQRRALQNRNLVIVILCLSVGVGTLVLYFLYRQRKQKQAALQRLGVK